VQQHFGLSPRQATSIVVPMPDDHDTPEMSRALRGLTLAEAQELAVLRMLMRNSADMTEAQRRRWFELSHRHDLMHG
jgi:hypothetical protein